MFQVPIKQNNDTSNTWVLVVELKKQQNWSCFQRVKDNNIHFFLNAAACENILQKFRLQSKRFNSFLFSKYPKDVIVYSTRPLYRPTFPNAIFTSTQRSCRTSFQIFCSILKLTNSIFAHNLISIRFPSLNSKAPLSETTRNLKGAGRMMAFLSPDSDSTLCRRISAFCGTYWCGLIYAHQLNCREF